jgi:hypothetical protein
VLAGNVVLEISTLLRIHFLTMRWWQVRSQQNIEMAGLGDKMKAVWRTLSCRQKRMFVEITGLPKHVYPGLQASNKPILNIVKMARAAELLVDKSIYVGLFCRSSTQGMGGRQPVRY